MPKQKYNVTGMTCSACSAHVEKAVRRVAGVRQRWKRLVMAPAPPGRARLRRLCRCRKRQAPLCSKWRI